MTKINRSVFLCKFMDVFFRAWSFFA